MVISVRVTDTKLGLVDLSCSRHPPWHEKSITDRIWRWTPLRKVSVSDVLALSEQRKADSKLRSIKPHRATLPCAKSRFYGIVHQLKTALLHYSRKSHLFKTRTGNPTALDSCRLRCFSVSLGDFPYISYCPRLQGQTAQNEITAERFLPNVSRNTSIKLYLRSKSV